MPVSPITGARRRLGPRFVALFVGLVAQVVLWGAVPSSATAVELRPIELAPEVLDALTIPDIQALMADGDLSSVRLTRAYLNRIREVDDEVNASSP